jgi:hypothetical protein
MGFMDKFGKALGFRTLGPDLSDSRPDERAKLADKRLYGEKNAEAKKNLKESMRILKLEGYTPGAKLRLPETRDLKFKDGTAWLNLVLALYDQDTSILADVLDLSGDVRRVLAHEKERRATMSEAMQKIFDAAEHDIVKKGIFNAPAQVPLKNESAETTPANKEEVL